MLRRSRENYDIFDLAKIILALMVVTIHTGLLPGVVYPWVRVAVPLFFMISSYLLFSKINNSPQKDKRSILKKSLKRQLLLYLLWTLILLLPIIKFREEFFENGILAGVIFMLRRAFVRGTFVTSWFIVANIEATIIVVWLSNLGERHRRFRMMTPVLLGAIYLICSAFAAYGMFFADGGKIETAKQIYTTILFEPHLSFPIATFWVYLGKIFADGKLLITKMRRHDYAAMAAFSALMLYLEWKFVAMRSGDVGDDLYLMLIPLVVGVFGAMLQTKIELKQPKLWRELSVVIFTTHVCFTQALFFVFDRAGFSNGFLRQLIIYAVVVTCSSIVYLVIKKLEKIRFLKVLAYLH